MKRGGGSGVLGSLLKFETPSVKREGESDLWTFETFEFLLLLGVVGKPSKKGGEDSIVWHWEEDLFVGFGWPSAWSGVVLHVMQTFRPSQMKSLRLGA